MKWLFLQDAAQVNADFGALGAIMGILIAFIIFFIIFGLILYIYTSLALMKIAKRTNTPNAWLAWIPFINLFLIARIAKMHWWPMLLFPLYYLITIGVGFLDGIGATILGFFAFFVSLVLFVFIIIWQWKMFEAVGRPGWWILISLIPVIGTLIYFVLLGVAAWGKPEGEIEQIKTN